MIDKVKNIVKLLRPWQWYKSLIIFIALIFTWGFIDINNDIRIVIGFISLSLISSFNYIVNDIIDKKKDMIHPEKKHRPIASGKISVAEASIFAGTIFLIGMSISYLLSIYFFWTLVLFVVITTLYSVFLKDIPLLDVFLISFNFVLRGVSGAFILGVIISPWLIVCTFLTAAFLAFGKRNGDLIVLGKDAIQHKKVFAFYNKKRTLFLLYLSSSLLLLSYALYTLFTGKILLVLTVPLSIYFVYRFLYHIKKGDEISRKAHLFIKDINMCLTLVIWAVLILAIEYYYVYH